MLAEIGNVLTQFISWIGEVVTALTTTGGDLYALLPLFAIGIAVSVFMVECCPYTLRNVYCIPELSKKAEMLT